MRNRCRRRNLTVLEHLWKSTRKQGSWFELRRSLRVSMKRRVNTIIKGRSGHNTTRVIQFRGIFYTRSQHGSSRIHITQAARQGHQFSHYSVYCISWRGDLAAILCLISCTWVLYFLPLPHHTINIGRLRSQEVAYYMLFTKLRPSRSRFDPMRPMFWITRENCGTLKPFTRRNTSLRN